MTRRCRKGRRGRIAADYPELDRHLSTPELTPGAEKQRNPNESGYYSVGCSIAATVTSDGDYVFRLRAFLAVGDVELNALVFGQ